MFTPNFDLMRALDCLDGVDADLLEHLAFSMAEQPAEDVDHRIITHYFYEDQR